MGFLKSLPDVDECSEGVDECSSDGGCLNTEGDYKCYCLPGYEGDGFICTGGQSHSLVVYYDLYILYEQSKDYAKSYMPSCHNATQVRVFSVSNYTDVDECAGDPCGSNADCTNTPGSFLCTCHTGYQGDGTTCTGDCSCLEKY